MMAVVIYIFVEHIVEVLSNLSLWESQDVSESVEG